MIQTRGSAAGATALMNSARATHRAGRFWHTIFLLEPWI